MATVYISIGSNIEREFYIQNSIRELDNRFQLDAVSPIYESAAVGFHGDPFYNLVVALSTQFLPQQVAEQLREIENNNLRHRQSEKFVSRTLDLDMLTYDKLILLTDTLQLPRREIEQYSFVLKPLSDIAPFAIHPLHQKTYIQMWRDSGFAEHDLRRIQWTAGRT